jgi:hypothetical protein
MLGVVGYAPNHAKSKQSWHMFASTCNGMLICSNGMRFANIISSYKFIWIDIDHEFSFIERRIMTFFIHQQAGHNFTLEPLNGRLCNQTQVQLLSMMNSLKHFPHTSTINLCTLTIYLVQMHMAWDLNIKEIQHIVRPLSNHRRPQIQL